MGVKNVKMSTETVMKLLGFFHVFLGFVLMLHQAGSALASWSYMNSNMFEDIFMPGLWVGIPIFVLGVACFCQYKFLRPALHFFIIVFTVIVLVNCGFFMAFRVRFFLFDPEEKTFEDCESPRWPRKFMLDDPPHCNAQKLNTALGQSMLAFVSADIIVSVIGLVLLCKTEYVYDSFQRVSPNIQSDMT